MKREPPLYQTRLARRKTVLGGSSLWLGPDHVLLVRSRRFQEEYKRFYFREIRALTVQDLSSASILKWWDLIAAVIILLLFMFTVHGWRSATAVGVLLLVYAVTVLRRPTCQCYLYTAVSREALPPLTRVKQAERVLEQLRPVIEEAQRDMPPPSLEQLEQTDTVQARHSSEGVLPPLSQRSLALYAGLFSLLAVDAGVNLYSSHHPSRWTIPVVMTVVALQTVCAALTFIESGTLVRLRLRGLVIGALCFLYARYVITYFGVVFANALTRPGTRPIDMVTMFRNQYPQAIVVNEALAAIAFVLAVAGFAMLWVEQQRYTPEAQ